MVVGRAVPYALGAFVLGVLGLISRDFAFQWQPVPETVPLRSGLAIISAAVMVLGALAALWPRTARVSGLILAASFGVWALLLHGPRLVAHPSVALEWLGLAESATMAAGGVALYAETLEAGDLRRRLTFSSRIGFGASLLVFGLSHFVYLEFTAKMVPAWLPWPTGLAAATGAGHLLAGLAFLSNRRLKAAGPAITGMMGGFVLLLHIPRIIATPDSRMEWTMGAVALTLTGAAFALWRLNTDASNKVSGPTLLPAPASP